MALSFRQEPCHLNCPAVALRGPVHLTASSKRLLYKLTTPNRRFPFPFRGTTSGLDLDLDDTPSHYGPPPSPFQFFSDVDSRLLRPIHLHQSLRALTDTLALPLSVPLLHPPTSIMCMSGSVTLTPPRQSSSPVATAKRLYRDAARAFLVRDFALASRALAHAREALTSSSSITGHEWLELVRDSNTQQQQQRKEDVTVELWRKLAILRITLTATVLADEQQHVSSSANLHEDVSRLAALGPQQAVVALWLDAAHGSGIAVGSSAARDEIVADEQCALVHPTIAIALALAAVKLGELRLAARVAEAWLGAIDPAVEQALVRRTTASAQTEERLGASDMLASSAASLDPNSISLSNSEDSTAKPGGSTATSIVKAWYRLHDIYALHVLPRLGEWDAAVDFVKLQGVENGGWVSQARVTVRAHWSSTQLCSDELNAAVLDNRAL